MKLKRLLNLAFIIVSPIVVIGQTTTTDTTYPKSSNTSTVNLSNDTSFHFAGYSDITFASIEDQSDDLFAAKFAPIVHLKYKDWLLFEAEGEFEYEDSGEIEKSSALEYASLNVFVNDNLSISAGKFLSPVGQFVQNLHPSWINKLPSAPQGFMGGHGGAGATPNSDFGIQARGGFNTGGESRINYATFISNGPNLVVEELEDEDLVVEGYEFASKFSDENSNKAIGGRFGFLPTRNFEIGFSVETAKAAFAGISAADEHGAAEAAHDEESEEEEEGHEDLTVRDRDYNVWGIDFYYAPRSVKNLTFRGEFASTKLGSGASDEFDREQKRWEAWYAQASYLLSDLKVETVLRYGDYSPADGGDRDQWALGLNYVLKSNSVIKTAYEFFGHAGKDRVVLQYAYGF